MIAYLAIKFYEDCRNRELIEQISDSLHKAGIESKVMARDYEKWGEVRYAPTELMELTFKLIDEADLLVVEFSEKGVGLGIEAGYAHAKNKPIVVVAKIDSDISTTLQGVAKEVLLYDKPEELTEKFKNIYLKLGN